MKRLPFFVVAIFLCIPLAASAATLSRPFEVSGWIPYWRTATGTADVLPRLNLLTEVNPFVYTLKSDGTLLDNGSLDQEPWLTLRAQAKAQGVRFVPTVMTGNGDLLHDLLSNQAKRIALEDRIAALVKEQGFDGIDIDFEGKKAADKDYFSTFLKGLYQRMGDKWVMCTIESRTPQADRYYGTTPPADAGLFANDLREVNKYCDRVRIMAYDQQGIDLKLLADAEAKGQLYAPVGDPAWVEKVVNLMAQDIARNKIMIGVPTYGYEYDVTAYANNEYVYDILWTFNPGYAGPIAAQYGITPERASWGEMYFTYLNAATSTPPVSSIGASQVAAAASAFSTSGNTNSRFRLMVWPDAQSVADRIALAKKLGVRGVSVFKFDGGQDPNIWNTIASSAQSAPPASAGAPSGAALSRTLTLGSVGSDVRTLQRILNSDSSTQIVASGPGAPGSETDRFGAMTLRAVQKFQVKYGIARAGSTGYGVVGPATRAKLNSLLASL
ncbi:MAG: peptidoglycan-binding protein [Candidatus Kaiserbacteria bacterium]|nr:MAG: peptidoglycan-binding protein [Candidatus Kaiserbacteria bacterium]